MAQAHSRRSSGLGEMVSACCVVNTGQSASFNTFAVVEPSKFPTEEAGVCRHDDEIEFVRPSELNDLLRRIARQQDSRTPREAKLGLKERIELLSSKILLRVGNTR